MSRGIIKPLNMSFGDAIKRIFKSETQPQKPVKPDKVKKSGTTASPPIQSGVSPPSSS